MRTYTVNGTVRIKLDAWDGHQPGSEPVTGRIMQGAFAFGRFNTTLKKPG